MSSPTDRAGFYLCLARAFLPPREQKDYSAITRYLAADLAELASALHYPAGGALRDLRDAVTQVTGHPALLEGYSALFLRPPVAVPLNTGLYLDGAVMGPATAALEKCYRECGLERGGHFHDLPDHVALQLEFVAHLCAAEASGGAPRMRADDFLASFVHFWLPPLVTALERACVEDGPARVYLCLARLLQIAVDHDLRGYRPANERLRPDRNGDGPDADSTPV